MTRYSLLFGLWMLGACSGGAPAGVVAADGWTQYGAPLSESAPVTAATLLDGPDAFVGQTIVVEGRVADVCSKQGCWMVIADGARTMRVRMKDHAFSVAKDGTGSDCRVEGKVVKMELDAETVAHFEGESRKPEAMPEKSATASYTYEIEATGVAMRPAAG